jgi:8-oxo-dGTP pyrophosphatase MutT (NUDIX family)
MKYAMPDAFRSYKPGYMQVFGCICLDKDGNVLLVRGRGSQKWSFPKGHKHRKESSFECAKRELFEETGIIAPNTYTSYYKMKGGEYFVCNIDTPVSTCINDTNEIDMVQWFPLNELPTTDTNIDVSIFRSHLRKSFVGTNHSIKVREFIGTPRSLRSIQNIHDQIRDTSDI